MGTQTVVDFRKGPQGGAVALADMPAGTLSVQTNGGVSQYDAAYKGGAGSGGSNYGVKFVSASGAVDIIDGIPFTNSLDEMVEYVFTTPDVAPSADLTLAYIKNSSGAVVFRVYYSPTKEIYMGGISGGGTLSMKLNAPFATQYILDVHLVVGTATVSPFNGAATAQLLLASDRSIQHTGGAGTRSATNMNLGTLALATTRIGIVSAVTPAITMGMALVRIENDQSTFFTTYTPPANVPPTVAAIANQIGAVAAAATFTAVATDTDGSIASYAWTVTAFDGAPYTTGSLTGASLAITPSTNGGVGARYDVTIVVTDNNGGTSAPVTAKLLVPGTVLRVIAETTLGGWSAMGLTDTAANRVLSLKDASDTTGDQSPAAPGSPAETRLRLAPLVAASAMSLTLDHKLTAAASGTATVRLYQVNTIVMSWNISTLSPPTTTKQSPVLTAANVASGSISSITDWTELDLAFVWGP